ncbi:hypothetical protein HY090_01015 [Candidatus Kaiserbacteria bacterium]|nr:hypothetical protein [Candidatus Kaiserbacteria bacterium]
MKRDILGKALLAILIVAALGGYLWYAEERAPCASPIGYHIGTFDSRFGASQSEFLSALQQAAGIWNKAAGKTIFVYNTDGTLSINLIYDSREETTQKNQTLELTIEQGKQVVDSVQQKYNSLRITYDSDTIRYKDELSTYQQELDAYNQEVDYWNGQGGAPRSEYQKLSNEKDALAAEQDRLNGERAILNAQADQINALIDKYNLLIGHVNADVSEIN